MSSLLNIIEVKTKKDRKSFIRLPFNLYEKDPNWVPPLKSDITKIIRGKGSLLLNNGTYNFFLAKRGKEIVGRIAVGIDEKLNEYKDVEHAYFTLFESDRDKNTAKLLLGSAEEWAKKHSMKYLKGPVSPTNGDDYRGLLVNNFENPPAILMPYNHSYYVDFFNEYDEYLKYYAFEYDPDTSLSDRQRRLAAIAMKRYDFSVKPADFSNIKKLSKEFYKVTKEAMPDWEEDIIPPTYDEILDMAKTLKIVADPSLVVIAYSKDKPIGYFVSFPDFSDIIRKINGRLFPIGWIRFFMDKKKIKRARAAILFVVPGFRNKGVPIAMFVKALEAMKKQGFKTIEGSSISWKNSIMLANAKRIGGKHYKTYVVYGKKLVNRDLTMKELYGNAAWKFNQEHMINING
ncbi:MAG: GNAT family N-acetyltransferase [Kosmotogaceae bacterium]